MIDTVVAIYAAVKRTVKAMKWLAFVAGFLLIFLIGEFGDYLADDVYPDNKGLASLIFFACLAAFVCASWGLYYLMERLSGYEGSFSQFLSDKTPEPDRIAKYTRYSKAKRAFEQRAGQRPVVSPVPEVRVAILNDGTRLTLRPGSASNPSRPTIQADPPKGVAHPVVKTRL